MKANQGNFVFIFCFFFEEKAFRVAFLSSSTKGFWTYQLEVKRYNLSLHKFEQNCKKIN
jgi:hypothetical protein